MRTRCQHCVAIHLIFDLLNGKLAHNLLLSYIILFFQHHLVFELRAYTRRMDRQTNREAAQLDNGQPHGNRYHELEQMTKSRNGINC